MRLRDAHVLHVRPSPNSHLPDLVVRRALSYLKLSVSDSSMAPNYST